MPPSAELIAAVGKLSQQMAAAGVLLQAGGLASSANGAKVRLKGSKLTVIDGPFTEAKELIGGFAILEASSRAAAIEHGRRFVQLQPTRSARRCTVMASKNPLVTWNPGRPHSHPGRAGASVHNVVRSLFSHADKIELPSWDVGKKEI